MADHNRLITELKSWQKKNSRKIICQGRTETEDGRLILKLCIKDTKFRLLCPVNYPEHEDSFFMETECRDFWCVAVNEFIIDSPKKLTLGEILAKIYLYCTPASTKLGQEFSSENESDDDFSSGSENSEANDNDELEFSLSKKRRDWKEKEGELRLRYNRPKICDMFDGKIMDHPQQVFSNSAASAILNNDLIKILRSKESDGIAVDPIENDVCRWSVFFKDFNPGTPISMDLEKAEELYGYNYIQLQFDFTMDLYPSHPPTMTVVRPKLINVFDSEDQVEFNNWNPARDMMSVLKEIKEHFDLNARVNFRSKFNGINLNNVRETLTELGNVLENEEKSTQSPSALNSVEKFFTGIGDSTLSLARKKRNTTIEMTLTKVFDCLKEFDEEICKSDGQFTFDLALNSDVSEGKRNHEVKFARKLNYSPSKFEAIKQLIKHKKLETENEHRVNQESDKGHFNIITNPSFGLGSSDSRNSFGLQNDKLSVNNASTYGSKDSKNRFNGSRRRDKTSVEHSVVSSFNANVKTLEDLSSKTSKNSFFESNANFSRVYKTLEESVLVPFIRSRLTADAFFEIWLETSLYSKIYQIIFKLTSHPYLINLLAASDKVGRTVFDLVKTHGLNVKLILQKLADFADECDLTQVDPEKTELAKIIIQVLDLVESRLPIVSDFSQKLIADSKLNSGQKIVECTYRESLKDLKFSNFDIDLGTHTFGNDYNLEIDSSRNYFRVAQEFALLSKSLTGEISSAICVRTDNSKPSLMRALITGADGTSCSGGCFSFDIYLTEDYPNGQLKIKSTTFLDGEKTLHLSDCGSLSFDGHPASTILQILTSIDIEKLITLELFGKYQGNQDFAEPEFKKTLLSNIVQFSMINQIRKPTSGFERFIETHFKFNKNRIISELERYDFLKESELFNCLEKEFEQLEGK